MFICLKMDCVKTESPEEQGEKVLKIGNSFLICDSSTFHYSSSLSTVFLNEVVLPLTKPVIVSGELMQYYQSGQCQYYSVKVKFTNNDLCNKSINCKIRCIELSKTGTTCYVFDKDVTDLKIDAKSTSSSDLGSGVSKMSGLSLGDWKVIFQIEERQLVVDEKKPQDQMIEAFSKTFDDEAFKDVKFVVGDESFLAHKFVIAARSDVFYAMLIHDTKERKDGVIEIQDVGMPALKSFVKYLYTDQVDNIEEEVEELLMLADKYNVPSLQDKCQEYMYLNNTINESNAISYLIKAHKYNSKLLKKLALISTRYYISKILQTDDLDQLDPYPSLMKDLISLLGDKDVNSSAKRLGLER